MKCIAWVLVVSSLVFGRDTLIVEVNEFRPMVILDSGTYSGFDIDLWTAIAKEANLSFKFKNVPVFEQVFKDLEDKSSDVALSGITITRDRENSIDFSHKYYESGLSVLVRDANRKTIWSSLGFIFHLIKSISGYILFFFGFMTVMAVLVILAEKKTNPQFKSFMWDGIYWVNVVLATVGFGDKCPTTRRGKLIAMFLMCVGIFFITPMIVGKISSEMTAAKITEEINTKDDLRGKIVGAIKGTTSVASLKKVRARVVEFNGMPDAVAALKSNKIDAVVFDMPSIKYEATLNSDLRALDFTFDKQDYGIALQDSSVLRETINRALLKLEEDGTYTSLYNKYFGTM